ncbi:MAG: hypothetical protein KDA91_13015, partial [Planctomycetaceae bacterium]|nr:hypothetical protein [Planctomycetaceae bacterium]
IDGNQTVTISAFPAGLATRTTTLTVTDASVPVIPGGIIDTNSTMPTITWNAMDNATRYAVWANYASGPTNGIINVSNISTNSYTPTTELGIGVYWIWVRGFTSSNAASAWSTPKMMRVKTPPSITGAANRTVTDPDFSVSWEALPGAAYYDVWVDQLSTSTSAYFRNSHVNGTSVDLTGFEPGKYGIWVRGFTARGDVGNWSPRTTITVAPTAQNVNVTAASVTSTPTLNWDAIPGMSTYAVWVNNLSTGTAAVVNQTGIATNSLELSSLPAGSYVAWIQGIDASNNKYAWSSPYRFEIGIAAKILTPASSQSSGTPLFSWTQVAGATRYELWVSSLNGAGRVIHETNVTATQFTPATSLGSGNYRMWVRAFDSSNASTGWSASYDFDLVDADNGQMKDALEKWTLEMLEARLVSRLSEAADETVEQVFAQPDLIEAINHSTGQEQRQQVTQLRGIAPGAFRDPSSSIVDSPSEDFLLAQGLVADPIVR